MIDLGNAQRKVLARAGQLGVGAQHVRPDSIRLEAEDREIAVSFAFIHVMPPPA